VKRRTCGGADCFATRAESRSFINHQIKTVKVKEEKKTFSILRNESMLSIFCNSLSSRRRTRTNCESSVFGTFFKPFFERSRSVKLNSGSVYKHFDIIAKVKINFHKIFCSIFSFFSATLNFNSILRLLIGQFRKLIK
jgi:hypothetical protein